MDTPSRCFVCGYKAATIIDVLTHARTTEDDDQHRRYLSARHGTGLTADLEQLAAYQRQGLTR